VELLRAPEVSTAEIDAFLAALVRPLPPGESPQQRDKLLRSIIQDARIGAFRGSDGRTVRDLASEVLRALSKRYGLEVPRDLLPSRWKQQNTLAHVPLWSTSKGMMGLALIVLAGLGELLLVQSFGRRSGELGTPPWSIPHVAATTFLPVLVAVLGDGFRRRWLYGLGLIWLVLSGALCVAGGLVWSLGDVFGLAVLSAGVLTLIGTKMLDASKKP
jgi:hypothetical protein